MAEQWHGATALTAPLVRHLLPPVGHVALCGVRRRSWLPVESFERPGVFSTCTTCSLLYAAGAEVRNAT